LTSDVTSTTSGACSRTNASICGAVELRGRADDALGEALVRPGRQPAGEARCPSARYGLERVEALEPAGDLTPHPGPQRRCALVARVRVAREVAESPDRPCDGLPAVTLVPGRRRTGGDVRRRVDEPCELRLLVVVGQLAERQVHLVPPRGELLDQ
jgi:hypothetical protein